jgi:hypothetical protein
MYLGFIARATLSQNTTVTKASGQRWGIIDMHIGDMLWAIFGCFIISSDLDLANINLNYTCHICSHDSYHLCYNPSINDD